MKNHAMMRVAVLTITRARHASFHHALPDPQQADGDVIAVHAARCVSGMFQFARAPSVRQHHAT